jgi:predicted phage baseplate assembly protein
MIRPAGVKAVNNPLPAADAADPEGLEQARDNVTLTIRTLDRVVSLQDYADFARAFAGIAKATATWTWSGQQRIVLLTVAGSDGATVDRGGTLYDNLRSAITQASEPFVSLQLMSYAPGFFQLSGSVTVLADHNLNDVAAAVETALRNTFSFAQRAFGQPVRYSEVVATIQNVPGVQDVAVSQLFRSDSSPAAAGDLPPADLPAALPRAGGDEIFAAELLTLDPRPLGLTVTQ